MFILSLSYNTVSIYSVFQGDSGGWQKGVFVFCAIWRFILLREPMLKQRIHRWQHNIYLEYKEIIAGLRWCSGRMSHEALWHTLSHTYASMHAQMHTHLWAEVCISYMIKACAKNNFNFLSFLWEVCTNVFWDFNPLLPLFPYSPSFSTYPNL